jgi:sugar lactone lactonase YvrE
MATAITSSRNISVLCEALLAAWVTAAAAQPGLFESRQVTPPGEYTFGIEGPAADTAGRLYVVNFGKQGTIGLLGPDASASTLFAVLPEGSIGNAIRFDRDGRMYVADYKKHNVFMIPRGQSQPQVYFHSDQFNQPNDLTVAADGTLYASDPHWRHRDGQVWRIARGAGGAGVGEVMTSDRKMGTTNGIDLSPDGATLYVGESETREIWAYRIDGTKLTAPRLLMKFPDFSLDGLRTDVDGRLYVTRILKGTVAVITPDGKTVREIPLHAKEPTNLAFGGSDGMTVFVTQRQGGFIEAFRVDRPGREYCLQTSDALCGTSPAAPIR